MQECELYDVCGLPVYEKDPEKKFCILHFKDAEKDEQAFAEALERHREEKGDNFSYMVFPDGTGFFLGATFSGQAVFTGATFLESANFDRATFSGEADFSHATFGETVFFRNTTFSRHANFSYTTFSGQAHFSRATLSGGAFFSGTKFLGHAEFGGATFSGQTLFSPGVPAGGPVVPIFSQVEANFRSISIDESSSLIFREADVSKSQFLNSDVRKIQFVGVKWPQIEDFGGRRFGIYDEIAAMRVGRNPSLSSIEQLYRQLKQNHEEQRDHASAGDFHYGEKEMRRKNPAIPISQRVLLTLYWLFSGYGERVLRPLGWVVVLLIACTFGHLWYGLSPKEASQGIPTLSLSDSSTWFHAFIYSFQVTTFFRPQTFVLSSPVAMTIYTIQSLLGPLLLGLFALAIRQKMKR